MFYISEISHEKPQNFETKLQQKVYETLEALKIPFSRVETDEAVTMDDCVLINEKLQMDMVKTLFLCNRQKTEFYLFITKGNKPFSSKDFSSALSVPRVSFAPAELMQKILGTKIGAATIFSILLESAKDVKIVIDADVASEKWYGCSDGTTKGYLKIETADIIGKLSEHAKRKADIIEIR